MKLLRLVGLEHDDFDIEAKLALSFLKIFP